MFRITYNRLDDSGDEAEWVEDHECFDLLEDAHARIAAGEVEFAAYKRLAEARRADRKQPGRSYYYVSPIFGEDSEAYLSSYAPRQWATRLEQVEELALPPIAEGFEQAVEYTVQQWVSERERRAAAKAADAAAKQRARDLAQLQELQKKLGLTEE